MDHSADEREAARRRSAEELLREFGERARLVVYVAAAPGAGKTRRLLTDARRLLATGKRVAIGWIETKGRPDLERLAEGIPRIPPRNVTIGTNQFKEFDLDAALDAHPDVVLMDELAHDNLGDARNGKRWQDALELRAAGITVLGAFNISHLETVSAIAERLIGYPVREIVPLSFLKAADEVIALDASPAVALIHHPADVGSSRCTGGTPSCLGAHQAVRCVELLLQSALALKVHRRPRPPVVGLSP